MGERGWQVPALAAAAGLALMYVEGSLLVRGVDNATAMWLMAGGGAFGAVTVIVATLRLLARLPRP